MTSLVNFQKKKVSECIPDIVSNDVCEPATVLCAEEGFFIKKVQEEVEKIEYFDFTTVSLNASDTDKKICKIRKKVYQNNSLKDFNNRQNVKHKKQIESFLSHGSKKSLSCLIGGFGFYPNNFGMNDQA